MVSSGELGEGINRRLLMSRRYCSNRSNCSEESPLCIVWFWKWFLLNQRYRHCFSQVAVWQRANQALVLNINAHEQGGAATALAEGDNSIRTLSVHMASNRSLYGPALFADDYFVALNIHRWFGRFQTYMSPTPNLRPKFIECSTNSTQPTPIATFSNFKGYPNGVPIEETLFICTVVQRNNFARFRHHLFNGIRGYRRIHLAFHFWRQCVAVLCQRTPHNLVPPCLYSFVAYLNVSCVRNREKARSPSIAERRARYSCGGSNGAPAACYGFLSMACRKHWIKDRLRSLFWILLRQGVYRQWHAAKGIEDINVLLFWRARPWDSECIDPQFGAPRMSTWTIVPLAEAPVSYPSSDTVHVYV